MLSGQAILEQVPRLRRYARALTGDRFAADDLVQDTLERALAKWALFRPGSKPDAWLMSIMHNLFVNQLRQRAARPDQVELEAVAVEPATPARQDEGLALADLQSALDELSADQREVLLLVTLEEMSYEETARIVGVPVGTVMSRLSRARERLRRLLAGEDAATPALRVIK
jgi:RNA polymerase sigma-70 factor (ECF subfamily)